MSAPPKTVLEVPDEEAAAIRMAVATADLAALGLGRSIARPSDAAELTAFLSDPAVSDAIYDLPRPLTEANVRRWIVDSETEWRAGRRLLIITRDETGQIVGYSGITVWPERSAAELAGAISASRQNEGQGGSGAINVFGWIFETLGVRLMCLTAAPENVRSARLIEGAGFVAMGVRESVRPDGVKRQSLYWEITREQWMERWG